MSSDIGNYALHAHIWDWGGYDRTEEFEYWSKYAQQYGKNVLIPMCALGETAVYMARKGFTVTAFDITSEMIAEGKKRVGDVPGVQLLEGDITNFCFNILPADFCFCTDFGHLHTLGDIKKALSCINAHLRDGGCLVIETGLPEKESKYFPPKTFHPNREVYPNQKVWKTGDTRIDAETSRTYISQTVYIEDRNGSMKQFDHSFYLQSYPRDEWIAALIECGFEIKHEYRSREKEPWRETDGLWLAEAVKRSDLAKGQ